jgi:predicted transcriptional regulator
MRALHRATDPDTSAAAAHSLGDVTALERKVYDAILAIGPATLDEVMDATGLEKVTASPRFRPLAKRGFISEIGKRAGKAGRMQTVWCARS